MVPTAWIYSIQFGFWPPQLHQHLHPHSTYHLGSRTYPLPLGFNTGQEMTKNKNIWENTSRWTYIDWHMSEILLLTDAFHLSTMASSLLLLEISSNMLQLQHTTAVHLDTTLHRMHSHNVLGWTLWNSPMFPWAIAALLSMLCYPWKAHYCQCYCYTTNVTEKMFTMNW